MNVVSAGPSVATLVHPQHKDVFPPLPLAGTPALKEPTVSTLKPRHHGYSHFRHLEEELLSRWVAEGKTAAMISELLKRDLSTVASRMKQLRTRHGASHTGRSCSLSAMDEKKIARTAEHCGDGEEGSEAALLCPNSSENASRGV